MLPPDLNQAPDNGTPTTATQCVSTPHLSQFKTYLNTAKAEYITIFERTFLVNSPRIDKIEVIRHARVRRKQLYYLRGLTGKAARLKELRPMTSKQIAAKEAARVARAEAQAQAQTPISDSSLQTSETTSSANE